MASPFYEIDPPGLNIAVAYTIYLLAFKHNLLAPFQLGGKTISRLHGNSDFHVGFRSTDCMPYF